MTKAGEHVLRWDLSHQYFAATDYTCSGVVLGTDRKIGNTMSLTGLTTVTYKGQPQLAAKNFVVYQPATHHSGGIDQDPAGLLAYPDDYLKTQISSKYLLMRQGNELYFGDETKPRDDQGYLTTLEIGPGAIRQP